MTSCDICLSNSCTIPDCPKVFYIEILPTPCHCPCYCGVPYQPLLAMLGDLIKILLPGLLIYLIWSFAENIKLGRK
jgi:hypothetical protein